MRILAQRPDATQVAGFHAWRRMGRYVKAGERPIVIQAPILEMSDDDDHDDGHGAAVDAHDDHDAHDDDHEQHEQVVGYTRVGVYDVSQTVGKQVSRRASDILEQLARLKRFMITSEGASAWPVLLRQLYRRTRDGGHVLRPGISSEDELGVLAEFVASMITLPGDLHGTGHRRDAARAVSYVVLRRLGYSTTADQRACPLLQSRDKARLIEALTWIRETANEITAIIKPEIDLTARCRRRHTLAKVTANGGDEK